MCAHTESCTAIAVATAAHHTTTAVTVTEGVRAVQTACGSRHTLVLAENGRVYSFGDRENGVVGHRYVCMYIRKTQKRVQLEHSNNM
jgi:alpha-tubulin suppressor-like RCC1 family protein